MAINYGGLKDCKISVEISTWDSLSDIEKQQLWYFLENSKLYIYHTESGTSVSLRAFIANNNELTDERPQLMIAYTGDTISSVTNFTSTLVSVDAKVVVSDGLGGVINENGFINDGDWYVCINGKTVSLKALVNGTENTEPKLIPQFTDSPFVEIDLTKKPFYSDFQLKTSTFTATASGTSKTVHFRLAVSAVNDEALNKIKTELLSTTFEVFGGFKDTYECSLMFDSEKPLDEKVFGNQLSVSGQNGLASAVNFNVFKIVDDDKELLGYCYGRLFEGDTDLTTGNVPYSIPLESQVELTIRNL